MEFLCWSILFTGVTFQISCLSVGIFLRRVLPLRSRISLHSSVWSVWSSTISVQLTAVIMSDARRAVKRSHTILYWANSFTATGTMIGRKWKVVTSGRAWTWLWSRCPITLRSAPSMARWIAVCLLKDSVRKRASSSPWLWRWNRLATLFLLCMINTLTLWMCLRSMLLILCLTCKSVACCPAPYFWNWVNLHLSNVLRLDILVVLIGYRSLGLVVGIIIWMERFIKSLIQMKFSISYLVNGLSRWRFKRAVNRNHSHSSISSLIMEMQPKMEIHDCMCLNKSPKLTLIQRRIPSWSGNLLRRLWIKAISHRLVRRRASWKTINARLEKSGKLEVKSGNLNGLGMFMQMEPHLLVRTWLLASRRWMESSQTMYCILSEITVKIRWAVEYPKHLLEVAVRSLPARRNSMAKMAVMVDLGFSSENYCRNWRANPLWLFLTINE